MKNIYIKQRKYSIKHLKNVAKHFYEEFLVGIYHNDIEYTELYLNRYIRTLNVIEQVQYGALQIGNNINKLKAIEIYESNFINKEC